MPLRRLFLHLCSLLAIGVLAVNFSTASLADVWVFEPSAAIDQRFDDNFTIDQTSPDATIATRLVGTLGLSREAPNAKFAGLLRVDGLITNSESRGDQLSSNRVAFLSSQFTRARSEYGVGLNYKFDTPNRDISADLTDPSSVAADTRANVTQDQNVARERWVVSPNWRYNLTRRTTFETDLSFTSVTHELPSVDDALRTQFAEAFPGEPVPDQIDISDVRGVFIIRDELDDFTEVAADIGIRTKLSPITTLSFFAGYSEFEAKVEPHERVRLDIDSQTDPIPGNNEIRRSRKRQRFSNTTRFRLGYDRSLTPTLVVGAQVGVYTNATDDTRLIRLTDTVSVDVVDPNTQMVVGTENTNDPVRIQQEIDSLNISSTGFLANISLSKSTGVTRYSARFGVDVLPSDVGLPVESLEAVGDLFHQLGPLLDISFRVRAFEPDVLEADSNDDFSRRFLSLEPKLIWRFSRAWTVAGSYRYRRQKSLAATSSGESNAFLFSLKYTPPSAIRDAELGR